MMIDTRGTQTTCLYCGRPLIQAEKKVTRPRQYCNDVHRQLAYRKRHRQRQLEAMRQRWSGYREATKALLEDILREYGEALASRVESAISDEQEARIAALQSEKAVLQARL